jgi:hypothetical protein
MIKRHRRFIILAVIFVASSALIYFIHYRIFGNPYHIFIYLIGDLAFLPLEVFIVVIVIERILAYREKQALLSKLNMVVGAFFSEVGNNLITNLICSMENRDEIFQCLAVKSDWQASDFKRAALCAHNIRVNTDCRGVDLEALRAFLIQKREFLLRLLENPNLLEHERFTDLLWAVFHLAEELEARPAVQNLPESDREHLAGDIQRVYGPLVSEWILYLDHLKSKYPYLFSLVLRTHPFQPHPSPMVA